MIFLEKLGLTTALRYLRRELPSPSMARAIVQNHPEKELHLTPSTISSVAALPPQGFARRGKRSRAHPHCPVASSTQRQANVLYWKTLGAIIFLAKYDVFARRPGAQKIECDKAEIVCQGKNSAFASLFHRYKKVDIL